MSSRFKKCVAAFSTLAIVLTLMPNLNIAAADVASTEESNGNTPLSEVTTNIGKIEYLPEIDKINAYVPEGSTTVFTKDRDFNVEESEGEKVININCTESSYDESNIYIPFSENDALINKGSKVKVSFDYYVDSGSAQGDGNGFRVWLGRANDVGCMVSSDTIAWFEDNAKGNNRFVLNRGSEYKNVEFEMETTGDNINAIVFKWIFSKPVRNLHIKNIRVWRDIDVPGSELTTLKDSLILYHNADKAIEGEDGSVSIDRKSAGYNEFKGFRIPLDRIICNEGDAVRVTIFGESSGGGKPRLLNYGFAVTGMISIDAVI